MAKLRLDKVLAARHMASTRSQAEDLIRRGFVKIDGTVVTKTGALVDEAQTITLLPKVTFVSRAGEKLYSVIEELDLHFYGKLVLDVGSSTGGFTEVSLREGARKVIAVDVGTDQLHASLRQDSRIELHEKTDIRSFHPSGIPDVVVIDVSFISLAAILPYLAKLINKQTIVIAMVKPQFEAQQFQLKHKGVIKNDRLRRDIFKHFESWVVGDYVIEAKADSKVAGAKGNRERFYKLHKVTRYK